MKEITIKINDLVYKQLKEENILIYDYYSPSLTNKFLQLLIEHIDNGDKKVLFAANITK